ncbi:hypothetical protein L2725_01325 [Shewanella corallii]|uniref:Uncharacterized protein n=1 Tax=Shewanella corallii TaxID=560080 RepID=A0ABT0N1W8_9GAMM|nr:hypothetical protein [Shewanella corallii]MCL2912434.1 hypothetical protein [Shewanella corallii]
MRTYSFIFLLLFSGPLWATGQDWQFNGYLNQAYANVDGSEFIVGDDSSSFDLTEVMATASWQPLSAVRLAGALTYRQWGTLAESDVRIDYLFAESRWQLSEGHLGLRAGRMKNEVGFYSSTRDMSFTRPGIMLPQSIYSDYFRDAQLHVDGGDFFGRINLSEGILDWHVMAGRSASSEDLTRNIFGEGDFGELDSNSFFSVDLEYQADEWRIGTTYYSAGVEYHPGGVFFAGELDLHAWVFSAEYSWRWFELTGELLLGDRHTQGVYIPPAAGKIKDHNRGYYLEGRALLPENVELFLRYDDYVDNTDDDAGSRYAAQSGNPAYFAYSKDWTFGGRWLLNKDWLLAAEYHWIEGAAWVSPLLTRDPNQQAKNWSMLMLQLSYRIQW